MSRIKRLRSGALLAIALCVPTLLSAADLSRIFAGCAGRLSAEMEHAWLLGSAEAERFEAERETFVNLAKLATSKNRVRDALNHRIEVKLAHAALLTQASFSLDPEHAEAAAHQAAHLVHMCRSLLLDS